MTHETMTVDATQIAILFRGPGSDLAAATPVAVNVDGRVSPFDPERFVLLPDGSVQIGNRVYHLARVLGSRPAGEVLELNALYQIAPTPAVEAIPCDTASYAMADAMLGLGPGFHYRGARGRRSSSGGRRRRSACQSCDRCGFRTSAGTCRNPNRRRR